ncbi:LOW QUALITY PROTEIN: gastrin/cholecystokinin type B receptor [Scaptodrosophila lebanonensis]|uniref:Gastrin/cholecystokinin type B receptor n=1 Tax=Drosophila lebanonensis TaxID=7225 RepID=A0A6J2U383_DROLE|nr:LOW QUALITY PROTEIN: gastrin/cholecystokinin type B receptor [Scaptodrosophila lebanonensis]
MYSAEQFATAEDAAQTAMAAAAAYKALLAFYANERQAASHIVSLTLAAATTGATTAATTIVGNNSSISISNNTNNNRNESSYDDDALATNFYVNTHLDGELITESVTLGSSMGSTSSSVASASSVSSSTSSATEMPVWLIPSYSIILLFAVVGNLLVISTLVQNRRMRTITNLFLLNLAISDMLLGVLCMPVTLVGTLLRNFIFGEFLCKLIQFSQAASVAVSSWTLVAISCERYYAICHPLRSRSWQTISHAYKIIGFIWLGGILCMTPIAVFSQLIPTSRPGYCKCREQWPDQGYERFYNILLDLILLVLPLMVLCVAYILITRTLYVGMASKSGATKSFGTDDAIGGIGGIGGGGFAGLQLLARHNEANTSDQANSTQAACSVAAGMGAGGGGGASCILVVGSATDYGEKASDNNNGATTSAANTTTTTTTTTPTQATQTTVALAKTSPSLRVHDAALRRSNEAKTLESKKRVVKMLFVLVLEFFLCWTPLYVINTLGMFIGPALYEYIDYTSISYLQLLAYSSSCCNPITYCFMNASFRRAFVDTFKGLPWHRRSQRCQSCCMWRSRSRHEMVSLSIGAGNSVVHTNSATDGPRL